MQMLFSLAAVFCGHKVVVCGQVPQIVLYEGLMEDCPYRLLTQWVDALEISGKGTVYILTRRPKNNG